MTGRELIYKVYEFIEKMINDEYDLIQFQADFPLFVHENYASIKKESYEVARLLNDDWTDYYEVVEWYDDKDEFIKLIKEGYKNLLEIYPKK